MTHNQERETLECPLAREPLKITMHAVLIRAAKTPSEMDAWSVRLESDYPGEITVTYSMGVGNRRGWYPGLKGVHDFKSTRPAAPRLRDVLASIGMDYATAEEMPADEADAMNYLASELGFDGKRPSEVLRTVRAINKQAADLRAFLKHTGIDPRHFADWATRLEG